MLKTLFPGVSRPRNAAPLAPAEAERREQQARIDRRLRAIERQGTGGVHFGHALAYLLVFTFSVGALIALAGDALRTFIAQAQGGAVDIPSLISFVVSFVLVFAMDTAMVRAAATVRMLRQRHQPGAGVHVAVIAVVCVVESATYLYMSYEYDHPGRQVVVWTILAVRAIIAPIVAVYLSLGRQLPVSARDINTQVETVTGRGVLLEMTRIADDPRATTERKVALYRASAIMDGEDATRLDAIITAERATRAAALSASLSLDPAPPTIPMPFKPVLPTQPDFTPDRALTHEERRRLLEAQMRTDLDEYDPDEDEADGEDDGDSLAFTRQPHPTHPRSGSLTGRAYRSNGSSGSSPARIEPNPRLSELTIDLTPAGRTAIKGDTPEARRVLNYIDKHPGAKITEVMRGADVARKTAQRYYSVWYERNRRFGEEPQTGFTEELAAITQDMLSGRVESAQ